MKDKYYYLIEDSIVTGFILAPNFETADVFGAKEIPENVDIGVGYKMEEDGTFTPPPRSEEHYVDHDEIFNPSDFTDAMLEELLREIENANKDS